LMKQDRLSSRHAAPSNDKIGTGIVAPPSSSKTAWISPRAM
jgi:hypothetical protein